MADRAPRPEQLASRLREWTADMIAALQPKPDMTPDELKHIAEIMRKLVLPVALRLDASRRHPTPAVDSQLSATSASPSLSEETFKEDGVRKETAIRKQATRKPVTSYSAGFLEFWGWWTGPGSKKEAFLEWGKLSQEDRNLVKADLVTKSRFTRDPRWAKDDGAFVKHACRYLKNAMWEEKWDRETPRTAAEQAVIDHYAKEAADGR